jgi:hypothetical protein
MTNNARDDLDGLTRTLLPIASDAESIGRLYGVVGEFCHVLRNRLNCLKLGLYLAQRPDVGPAALDETTRYYREIELFVERIQAICRPMRLTRVAVPLGQVLAERRSAWADWLAPRGRVLQWSPPHQESPASLDPGLLAYGLDALVSWRAEAGRAGSAVRLAWRQVAGEVRLSWEEPAEDPPAPSSDRAPSLALPLMARILAAHDGNLELREGDGFALEMTLPVPFNPRAEWEALPRATTAPLPSQRVG